MHVLLCFLEFVLPESLELKTFFFHGPKDLSFGFIESFVEGYTFPTAMSGLDDW